MLKNATIRLIAVLLLCSLGLSRQTPPAKTFDVPGHGKLQLSIPAPWKVDFESVKKPEAINLKVTPGGEQTFNLQITSVVLDRKSPMNADSAVKDQVRVSGEQSLPNAVEKDLMLVELHGAQSSGWYFALTDKAPGPGEFKYMKQGTFRTGELLNMFTLLSNAPDSADVRQIMAMLTAATYSPK